MKKIVLSVILASAPAMAWTHLGTNLFGWKTKTLTFSVNPSNCTIPETTLYDILDSTLNAWNGIPNADVTLVRTTTPSTTTVAQILADSAPDAPVIVCDPSFGSTVGDPNQIIGVATNTRWSADGHITYSGIILNAQAGAGAELSQLSRTDIEIAIAHEIGHALGLGHSSVPEALMYYSVGNKPAALLTEDDMDGMAHLYPRSDFSGNSFGCSAAHMRTTKVKYDWAAVGILLILMNIYFGRRFSGNQT